MKLFILMICCLILCTGCWDQVFLKDQSLITAIGFDTAKDDSLLMSVSIPVVDKKESDELIYSHIGTTPRSARRSIERTTQKSLEPSRNKVILISEELARQDIYSILDKFYRDPRSSLIAKIAVVDGKVNDLFHTSLDQTQLSEFVTDLLTSVEKESQSPAQNLQIICPLMFDPGYDFAVPYLRAGKNTIDFIGIALFDGTKMTGKLDSKESVMYLILADNLGKTTSITKKIHTDKVPNQNNYITFRIDNLHRNLQVTIGELGEVVAKLDIDLKIAVTEYPEDELQDEEKLTELSTSISESLTSFSEEVLQKMQVANFDGFGIGRHVYAFHQNYWKQHNWKEVYPSIDYQVSFNIEIVEYGIIN